MTCLEQSEYRLFQGFTEQKMGQYSMQKMASIGSNFGANQQCPIKMRPKRGFGQPFLGFAQRVK